MCSISGISWNDESLIKQMNESMKHRGIDGSGIYVDKISLGHTRLKVIDLSDAGKQPMCNENQTVWIVFNGEIYNYKEFDLHEHTFQSKTDTEVILHLYEKYGLEMVRMLNGIFAFAIYDSTINKIYLVRDRTGTKPLFYSVCEEGLIFASEIPAILKKVPFRINNIALNEYLSLRYNPNRETIVKDVYKVKAGTYIEYDIPTKKINRTRYYYGWMQDGTRTDVFETFKQSVKRQLVSDVPIGVFLSGGIDSTSIVGMMRNIAPDSEIKTFTIGFDNNTMVDERKLARTTSEYYCTNHHEYVMKNSMLSMMNEVQKYCSEPLSDPALIPLFVLSRNAKKEVSVVLSGDGGDELFAGYAQHKFLSIANRLPKIVRCNLHSVLSFFPKDLLYKHSTDMGRKGNERLKSMLNSEKSKQYYEFLSTFNDNERRRVLKPYVEHEYLKQDEAYFRNSAQYLNNLMMYDIHRMLCEGYLMKTDAMTMAHSLECRVPFLDNAMLDLSFNMNNGLKLRGLTGKWILRKQLNLPEHIVNKQKQTFHVPIEKWCDELLYYYEPLMNRSGLFKKHYIYNIINKFNDSKLVYVRQIYSLLSFEIFHKQMMEKNDILPNKST